MQVILLDSNILNVQKCYMNVSRLMNNYREGQIALIKVSDACKFICKIFFRKDVHPAFIHVDTSVIALQNTFKVTDDFFVPHISQYSNYLPLSITGIELLEKPSIITLVNVTVVVENVKDIIKWKCSMPSLVLILKSLLKLYVVSPSSLVNLTQLKSSQRRGLCSLFIHSAAIPSDIRCGRINSGSKITVVKLISKKKFDQFQNHNSNPKIGGMEKYLLKLCEILSSSKLFWQNPEFKPRPDQQVLLAGPAGCGKSSLVRRVAADCGAVLLVPEFGTTPDVYCKLFSEATDLTCEGICVVLIEDIESVSAAKIAVLLERAAEVPGLCVVATTVAPSRVDPALRRPGRLAIEIYIGMPDESDRAAMLSVLLCPLLKHDELAMVVKTTAALTPGYVAADLARLCQFAALHISGSQDGGLWVKELQYAARRIQPSVVGSVQNLSPTPVAGLEDVKAAIHAIALLPLQHPDALKRLGLPPPKGILLYGPPGCAKTSLVRSIASDCRLSFLSCSAAEIYSPYVGEAEKNIVELFRRARLASPTLLFLDEIEALVGSRTGRDSGVQERVLAALLMEMDGLGSSFDSGFIMQVRVVVVAATNRPDLLDAALLRPGRIDRLVAVPPPDTAARLAVLTAHTAHTPLNSNVNLRAIAAVTELYSGADLAALCKEAVLWALTEEGMEVEQVSAHHFEHALSVMKPSLTRAQIEWYQNYQRMMVQIHEVASSRSSTL